MELQASVLGDPPPLVEGGGLFLHGEDWPEARLGSEFWLGDTHR